MPVVKSMDNSGPGAYLGSDMVSSFSKAQARGAPSAANLSRTTRGSEGLKPHPELEKQDALKTLPPSLTMGHRAELPDMLRSVAVDRAAQSHAAHAAKVTAPPLQKPAPRSAVFADTVLDRFGKPTVRYATHDDATIGPGSYEPDAQPKRMLIGSAWALSGVVRDPPKKSVNPPGPAYYQPASAPKQASHHMMSHDYWS